MRRAILLAIPLLALSACAIGADRDEDAFLEQMRELVPFLEYMDDDGIIEIGNVVCEVAADDAPLEVMLLGLTSDGTLGTQEASAFVVASLAHLCPQYEANYA